MIATTTTTHSAPRVDVRTQGDGTLVRVTGRIAQGREGSPIRVVWLRSGVDWEH